LRGGDNLDTQDWATW